MRQDTDQSEDGPDLKKSGTMKSWVFNMSYMGLCGEIRWLLIKTKKKVENRTESVEHCIWKEGKVDPLSITKWTNYRES